MNNSAGSGGVHPNTDALGVTQPDANIGFVNDVDTWIDDLDLNRGSILHAPPTADISSDVTMPWLVQQSLPRTLLPFFNGSTTVDSFI